MTQKRKTNRLQRIIQLLGVLQGGRSHNVQSLADACGVSRRTIFRDLDALREAEVPLYYDSTQQMYAIPSQYFLAPTQFSAEEARAIIILCHELGNEEHLPFLTDAREAAVKIENSLSLNLRAKLRDYANAVRIRLGCMTPLANHKTNFELLLEAIVSQRCIRVQYESYTEQKNITTLLHPYRLVFNLHSWYVIGRSTLHREVRTLNISRIHEPEMLEETFTMPQGFSLDRYFGNAWRMIPEPGPDQQVIIRFSPLVARNVAEVQWHPTQQINFESDGSLLFTVTVSGLNEISWWILGYGQHAEVLSPMTLREKITHTARAMLEKYGK